MPDLIPLDRDLVATFRTTRGSFTIPKAVLDAADEGDDYELRRRFAIGLPEHGAGQVLNTRRTVHKDGSATVAWLLITTTVRPARSAGPEQRTPRFR